MVSTFGTVNNQNISFKPIEESFSQNTNQLQTKINTKLGASKMYSFANFSENQQNEFRSKCYRKLTRKYKRSFLEVFCCTSVVDNQTNIHNELFELLQTVHNRCLEKPSIFRIEGDKTQSKELIRNLIQERAIDYSSIDIYVLGSAFKTYLRDYLDGLFEPKFIEIALEALKANDFKTLNYLIKLHIFSQNLSYRRLFLNLQNILFKISKHSTTTTMTLDGLSNIFCLTCTPQKVFKDLGIINYLSQFFRYYITCDMNNIELVIDL